MKKYLLILLLPALLQSQGLFRQNSTWYEKIPANPTLNSNSSNYIADILINSSIVVMNFGAWSTTFWYADGSTPLTDVTVTHIQNFKYDYIIANEWNLDVPIPLNATPPGEYDGLVCIVNSDSTYAWDCHQFVNNGDGTFDADLIFGWDLVNDDGVDCPAMGYIQTGNNTLQSSPRAAGTPLLHGMIMYDEMVAGIINHALAFAYWGSDGGENVYPSCITVAELSSRTWAMKLGMRLQLNPSLDINTLGLGRAGLIIAKALQDYGAIYVENDGVGSNSIYAESLNGKAESWSDIVEGEALLTTSSIVNIPINQLRILEPIYPDTIITDTTPPSTPTGLTITKIN